MTRHAKGTGTNVVTLILGMILFAVVAYYGMVALTSRDPLWFLGRFEDQPARIIVYHDGQRTDLQPGDEGFDELASAVQESLAAGFRGLTNIGLSEPSLQDAYRQSVTLEVFFARPVALHTFFFTGRVTQMLFPITGRHSEMDIAVLGEDGAYRSGAPALNDIAPIRNAMRALGYGP